MSKVAIIHPAPDSVRQAKAAKKAIKASSEIGIGNDHGGRAVTPVMGTGILANRMNFSTPPDNTMAISNGGRIVSIDNETIEYYNQSGSAVSLNVYHDDFFNSLNLVSAIFDPRVIYDSEADRFIYVILHGFSSATSKILVCFSKTNNPQDGWWIYQLSGNPLNDGSWTDFPQIGISNNELYITGNLFFNNSTFNQAVIYQVTKQQGFSGQPLTYQVWDDIEDAGGGKAFAIVPVSYGQQGNYGPGCYFISSRAGGWNRLSLFELTDDLTASNEQLNVFSVSVPPYSPAADAQQSGSFDDLENGDCRMQHAFYLNGLVHAVLPADYQNSAYSGINYYRISVSDLQDTESSSFGQTGFDHCYPSLASFGLDECDRSVMIGFLRSASNIFPEVRVVNCDNLMQWSASAQVKAGQTYVDMLSGLERWGDYTHMQRKHNEAQPEVWMAGCYGANNTTPHAWRAYLAEIKGTYEPAPVPVVDFQADDTLGYEIFQTDFHDNTLNNPTSWAWTFEGGLPPTSSQANPTITYADTGRFDVKLIVGNAFCTDSLFRENYIHVLSSDTQTTDTGLAVGSLTGLRHLSVYPNPVSAFELIHTNITVAQLAHVYVQVIDMQGKTMKVLFDDNLKAGTHRLRFNKLALPAGQYILQVRTNETVVAHEKIIVQY